MSWSKVRSRDSEATLRGAPTIESDSNRARRRSSSPRRGPKLAVSRLSGAWASAARVVSPRAVSRWEVLGPIPGTRPGGEAAKRSHACSRVSATIPAGFSASEATFATSLLGPIPTEHVSRVEALISATSRRIAARGENRPSRSR